MSHHDKPLLTQDRDAIISTVKVSELGEFRLIDLLAKMVHDARDEKAVSWQQLVVGIGDDAAVWRGEPAIQLATVDSLVQDIHFRLDITPWDELGWKAMAVNLSDIAAMGGVPQYALVALTLPGHTRVEDVRTLYRGMIEMGRQSGVAIVGGNISSAPIITISVTVLGHIQRTEHFLTRSSASPGELVAVTDYLGAASAGLDMLSGGIEFDPETTAYLKQAFLHPSPRIAEGQLLVEQGIKTAIDISDGLVSDLGQICKASQVSARIELDRVPIDPAVRNNFDGSRALELALSGGEDYELLFTGSAEAIEKVKSAAPCCITVIGQIIPSASGKNQVVLIDSKGNSVEPGKAGWEHFTTRGKPQRLPTPPGKKT